MKKERIKFRDKFFKRKVLVYEDNEFDTIMDILDVDLEYCFNFSGNTFTEFKETMKDENGIKRLLYDSLETDMLVDIIVENASETKYSSISKKAILQSSRFVKFFFVKNNENIIHKITVYEDL